MARILARDNVAPMQALLDTIAALATIPVQAQRLFHGRGGLHPGCEHLALDVYPPVLLLTSFKPLTDEAVATIGAALQARWPEVPWVYQCRQEGRTETRLMAGAVPEPHVVTEAGTRYLVHLLRGKNHGLFLDMAEGRRWVREHVKPGAKVLNLFAYTCAFSVVALQAGAAEVVNVDMASGAPAFTSLSS
jgi:23S rRNA (cytosine1962-C5)-methyltransferase